MSSSVNSSSSNASTPGTAAYIIKDLQSQYTTKYPTYQQGLLDLAGFQKDVESTNETLQLGLKFSHKQVVYLSINNKPFPCTQANLEQVINSFKGTYNRLTLLFQEAVTLKSALETNIKNIADTDITLALPAMRFLHPKAAQRLQEAQTSAKDALPTLNTYLVNMNVIVKNFEEAMNAANTHYLKPERSSLASLVSYVTPFAQTNFTYLSTKLLEQLRTANTSAQTSKA